MEGESNISYVNYNQSLYRTGFRPYGKSDPHAANQLEGYPFTETGGQMLHGLGILVPDQAIVTYNGTWRLANVATQRADDIIAAVSSGISREGLIVVDSQNDAGFWSTDIAGHPFHVTMHIQVNNGLGYNDPNDVASIVNHYYYDATGEMPPTGTASLTKLPGGGGTQLPDLTKTDWGKWLQDNGIWLGLGVVAVTVLPTLLRKVL